MGSCSGGGFRAVFLLRVGGRRGISGGFFWVEGGSDEVCYLGWGLIRGDNEACDADCREKGVHSVSKGIDICCQSLIFANIFSAWFNFFL